MDPKVNEIKPKLIKKKKKKKLFSEFDRYIQYEGKLFFKHWMKVVLEKLFAIPQGRRS